MLSYTACKINAFGMTYLGKLKFYTVQLARLYSTINNHSAQQAHLCNTFFQHDLLGKLTLYTFSMVIQ